MPTVSDVLAALPEVRASVSSLRGVRGVYLYGSVLDHISEPAYPVSDIDLIAETSFDSGDLLAIDAGPDSALGINPRELADLGFDPDAVTFTRLYASTRSRHVDPWATSSDGKLLHWGYTPESVDDWQESQTRAEIYASEVTGYNRLRLGAADDDVRANWWDAYRASLGKGVSKRMRRIGWVESEHPAADILAKSKKLEGI